MRLLILDNRDSFTYNIVESFRKIGIKDILVKNSSNLNIEIVKNYKRIVLGPGPGLPGDHPLIFDVLSSLGPEQSVLGICLGHEALAIHYGGTIRQLDRVFHGDKGLISWTIEKDVIRYDIPDSFSAGLYHSWIIDEQNLPPEIEITAMSDKGLIMGIKHAELPLYGFQFHPESFITKFGLQLLKNWVYQSV